MLFWLCYTLQGTFYNIPVQLFSTINLEGVVELTCVDSAQLQTKSVRLDKPWPRFKLGVIRILLQNIPGKRQLFFAFVCHARPKEPARMSAGYRLSWVVLILPSLRRQTPNTPSNRPWLLLLKYFTIHDHLTLWWWCFSGLWRRVD